MSDSSGDPDAWAFTEGSDWKSGRHRRENDYVHEQAGETDRPTTRKVLSSVRQAFERSMNRGWVDVEDGAALSDVEDLEKWQHLREHASTERFAEAVEAGDAEAIRAMVGSERQRPDLSGMRAIENLRDLVGQPAFIAYEWAEPGSGKTDFACLLGELWKREHPEGEVATNIRTLQEADRWINNYPSLVDWIESDQEAILGDEGSGSHKLFIFDEASSHASGRGAQGYETAKKLGPLLYKIRKFQGSLIIVGHDGRDVHPAVRALGKAIHKEGLKEATFYESVRNRQGENEIFSVEGIPPTSWSYDDKEATSWNWGNEDELEREAMDLAEDMADERAEERVDEELEQIAASALDEGQSLRQVASYHPWSRETIRRRAQS